MYPEVLNSMNTRQAAHTIQFNCIVLHIFVSSWVYFTCSFAVAQTSDSSQIVISEQNSMVVNPTTPASFPGGMENFYKYVINTIRMPRDAIGISGKVFVEFVIDSTGHILPEDIRVIKSLSKSCDKEAVRIIRGSPSWIPARENDKPVRQKMVLPISFLSMR